MPMRSDPTSNAEIVRNALPPEGFGRRLPVCFVAAPQRCSGIACVADASHPDRRRSAAFGRPLLGLSATPLQFGEGPGVRSVARCATGNPCGFSAAC